MRRQVAIVGAIMAILCAACDPGGAPDALQDGGEDVDRAGEDGPDATEPPPEAQDRQESPTETPGPEEPTPDEPPPDSSQPCEPATSEAIDETIAGQLEAFAANDFERALGFASSNFQSGIDVPAFQELIETEYPVVADGIDHELVLCLLVDQRAAQVRVLVTSSDGDRTEMAYMLVEEGGSWGIDGAVELSQPSGRVA